jgi:Domain of Unknown Function (DUF748)
VPAKDSSPRVRERRSRWRRLMIPAVVLVGLLVAARVALPSIVRWYVNRTLDQNALYQGEIGKIEIHLWRGAYSIRDVRLSKVTGSIPVPLFAAKRVDLAIQWDAIFHGSLVSRVAMEEPELNFVDAGEPSKGQTGGEASWLGVLRDLVPFRINRVLIHEGSVHFRAYHKSEPVDVYLSRVEGSVENLTNIYAETDPLIATVKATALAMDQAKLELEVKLDPFSYYPTFELALRLLGLDVTKTNSLARSYGAFDFEHGYFSLVVELKSDEGLLHGYIKPLFRQLKVLSLEKDIRDKNVLELFWEALLEVTTEVFRNQPKDQLATLIPVGGELKSPETDLFQTLANLLRNAFVRAYLPRLEGTTAGLTDVQFGKATILDSPDDSLLAGEQR